MEKSKEHKLGIILPYHDRFDQLHEFLKAINEYFKNNQSIDYYIIIVEQDDQKLFNRGMLLNIGFKYAEEFGCDYVVFHDVDMIPINVDYSYSSKPLQLANEFVESDKMQRIVFDEYFGGVTLFTIEDFKKINGYSNKYWGWGYEDNDLLLRCKKAGIKLDKLQIKNQGNYIKSVKFNGVDSYVRGKNIFSLNRNLTIFLSFYPDQLICNNGKKEDIYSVFSIPGYDTAISYNSYSRYNFCTFDREKNVLFINSNIKTNYKTNICATLDKINSKIVVYQDGNAIGSLYFDNRLMDYRNQKYFYLGVGDPNREGDEKYFRGYINQFAVFLDVLDEEQILEISENKDYLLNNDFGSYISSHLLQLYYDARVITDDKFIDLSGNGNNGELVNCLVINKHPKNLIKEEYKIIDVPFRRKGIFKLLPHEENGYINNGWKTPFTRWNQLRFYNEVSKDDKLLKNDGLSDLKFIEKEKIVNNNTMRIVISI